MNDSIEIVLNGEVQIHAANSCLADLVVNLGIEGSRYAIEVNEEIIPRSEHGDYRLNGGDKVEIVQAIGGG